MIVKLEEIRPLVSIPAGQIRMRDDRKREYWSVEIGPFPMGGFPVTQELYYAVTRKSPATFVGAQRPVKSVSWVEAVEFCNQLSRLSGVEPCYHWAEQENSFKWDRKAAGYRLPTEAEWEYACRAECSKPRYGNLGHIAWYKENSGNGTQDVGRMKANAWGLHDMLGNVWEWCWDVYDEEVYGSYRVFRGGGWADPERGSLATNRRRSHPTFKIDDLGFRLAMSL
ncbi:MAG: SUMF1/EgtB/PvdO family nonheme iron enzyme [Chitinivibrionales bacterium]|nr:SUMF1/EgtB/PvdO family nonheme iron enzyme [Chitinivibrionales bacterium]MBD3356906.1 SUMF1/EgtB/PvdO family nonheme iron enzyme [Chitinivibrionales bacterium]